MAARRRSSVDREEAVGFLHEIKAHEEETLIPLIARLLDDMVDQNNRKLASGVEDNVVTSFHALEDPHIPVPFYVERIKKYSGASNCCFVVGLVYIDRVLRKLPGFMLSSFTVHRLLLSSMLIAAKFMDDLYYSNGHWAKVGGVSLAELNALELEVLFLINFYLSVSPQEFLHYRRALQASTGAQAGKLFVGPMPRAPPDDPMIDV